MKFKLTIIILVITSYIGAYAQSPGALKVITTTSSTGGNYAPKNIIAVWIENENGKYVKTLAAYANARKAYLNTWGSVTSIAGSAYNTVDAITGATRQSHGNISCTWNGTDFKGNQVGDGIYKLRFELTDKHSTGNLASFDFSKGSAYQVLPPADVPSFKSTSIIWEPTSVTASVEIKKQDEFRIYYNPSSGFLTISDLNVKKIEIYNYVGQLVIVNTFLSTDLSKLPNGIYIIVVKTDLKNYTHKILKRKLID